MTDSYEEICELGRQAAQSIDSGRYTVGDLALLVQKHYKRDTIGRFAKDIGLPKARVSEYRRVCGFWSESERKQLFDTYNGMVNYTHLRDAMRLKDKAAALDFIHECGGNGYTVEQAQVKLTERLGKPVAPPKLLDGLAHVLSIRGDVVTFRVDAALEKALYDAMHKRTPVSIVVRTSEDEPDFKPSPVVIFGSGYERRVDTRLVRQEAS